MQHVGVYALGFLFACVIVWQASLDLRRLGRYLRRRVRRGD